MIWKKKLQFFYGNQNFQKIDLEYSEFISKSINKFIKNNNLNVDYISSHGHTIFHEPNKGITKQIGRGDVIFERTKIPVIFNFREQDVKLGGEGAPLVPYGDSVLFSNYDSCLNLGGFSNISFKNKNKITAFDICPLNIVLNYLVEKKNMTFDRDGYSSSKEQLITIFKKIEFNSLL